MRTFGTIVGGAIAVFVLAAMVAGLVQLNAPTPAYAEICPGFPATCEGWPQRYYDSGADCCYYGPPHCPPLCECINCK